MGVKDGTKVPVQVRPAWRRRIAGWLRNGKLAALGLVLLAGWSGYVALSSARFVVQTIRTEGNRALTAAEVARFAAVKGAPIWFVKTGEIQDRIAESPYVETVKVRLQLPNAVLVQVRERQPEVRWVHQGQIFAVTADGLVVDQRSDPATALITPTVALSGTTVLSSSMAITPTAQRETFVSEVTIVDTTPNRELKVRDRVDPDALELARRVMLRQNELSQPIRRIEWDAGLGVSLILSGDHRLETRRHTGRG
nr:POTRA domain, FtsQ-type [uncultured bacterium]